MPTGVVGLVGMDCAGGVVELTQLHSVWRGMPCNDWTILGSLDGYLRGEMLWWGIVNLAYRPY